MFDCLFSAYSLPLNQFWLLTYRNHNVTDSHSCQKALSLAVQQPYFFPLCRCKECTQLLYVQCTEMHRVSYKIISNWAGPECCICLNTINSGIFYLTVWKMHLPRSTLGHLQGTLQKQKSVCLFCMNPIKLAQIVSPKQKTLFSTWKKWKLTNLMTSPGRR